MHHLTFAINVKMPQCMYQHGKRDSDRRTWKLIQTKNKSCLTKENWEKKEFEEILWKQMKYIK